jgi:hypothetical protein
MRIFKSQLKQIIKEEVQIILEQFSLAPKQEAFYKRKAEIERKFCPPIVSTGQPDSACKAALNIETILPGYLPPCKPGVRPEMCNSIFDKLRDDEWIKIQSSCKPSMRGPMRCNYIILDPEKAEKSKPPKRMVKKRVKKRPPWKPRRKKKKRRVSAKPTPRFKPPVKPKPKRPRRGYMRPVGLPGSSAGLPGEEYVEPGR